MTPLNKLPEGFRLVCPDVVLYHAECPDGFGAAWALRQFFGNHVTYEPFTYGTSISPGQFRGKRVLMVDVSLPRTDFIRFSQEADVFLIDHHASAAEDLADLPNAFFDLRRSSAGIAWDIASSASPRPLLIDLIEDRDLGRNAMPQTRLLRVLDSLPHSFPVWSGFARALTQETERLEHEATAIERFERTQANRVLSHAVGVEIMGARGVAVSAAAFMTDTIASVALDCDSPPDFLMVWFYDPNLSKISCSWRTRPGCPVRSVEIARSFGGGGHPHAAGARIDWETLRSLLIVKPG